MTKIIDYASLAEAGVQSIIVTVECEEHHRGDFVTDVTGLVAYGPEGEVALHDDLSTMVEDAATDLADELEGEWWKAEVTISVPEGKAEVEVVD